MKRTLILLIFLLLALAGTLAVVRNREPQILPEVAPAIVSFTATPQVIAPGESITLDWETKGVSTVALEWGPANSPRGNLQKESILPPSGTRIFEPQEDTIYVLECETAPVPACTASATVRVR